jgi:hypothetical protein
MRIRSDHVEPPLAIMKGNLLLRLALIYGFHRQDRVDVRVARIFNTYGKLTMIAALSQSSTARMSSVTFGMIPTF